MRARLNGIDIHYEEAGDRNRPALIFIHGFPFDATLWTEQVALFQKDFRVIAYDLRGLGRSRDESGQILVDFLADDLAALMDHLEIERAALCGLSMGGYVALRFHEKHPRRVGALVLCDSRAEADGNEAKIKRADQIRQIRERGLGDFAESFLKGVFAPETFERRPDAVARVRAMILGCDPKGVAGMLIALAARTDATAGLAKIRVPMLVMVGEEDGITPPALSEAIHRAVPGSRFRVIPGAGHVSNLENPAEFNRALGEFLKEL